MRLMLAALSALLAMSAGCYYDCGNQPLLRIVSGTYRSMGRNGTRDDTPSGTFPWTIREPKTIEVDIEGRTVRLRYQRDGHDVVETWRITRLSE